MNVIRGIHATKFAFIVYHELFTARVIQLLAAAGIDYYQRWAEVIGKGHGTEAHLGRGGAPATNSVLMIAFQEAAPLETLI